MTRGTQYRQRSEAYRAGYAITISAPNPNIPPSTVDRENWEQSWTEFMSGWRAGQRATEVQIEAWQQGVRV